MFDPNFNPLEILEQVQRDQQQLYKNQEQLNQNIKLLVSRVNEQQRTIETILASLETLNKTNELALQQLVASMVSNNYSVQGQH